MRIKNWGHFQHYKDRNPVWIKLYRELLNDMEWNKLSGDASKALVNCWLVACEDAGELPPIETLAFKLRMDENTLKGLLMELDHWIETGASNPLSNGLPREEKRREEIKKRGIARDPFFKEPTINHVENLTQNTAAINTWLEYKPTDSKSRAWCHQLMGMGLSGVEVREAVDAQIEVFQHERPDTKFWPQLMNAIPDIHHARDLICGTVLANVKKNKKAASNIGAQNTTSKTSKNMEAEWKADIDKHGAADPNAISDILSNLNKGIPSEKNKTNQRGAHDTTGQRGPVTGN